jgi:hypothetical protein
LVVENQSSGKRDAALLVTPFEDAMLPVLIESLEQTLSLLDDIRSVKESDIVIFVIEKELL